MPSAHQIDDVSPSALITLSEISRVHSNAYSVAANGIAVYAVKNKHVSSLDGAIKTFRNNVDRLDAGAAWKAFASIGMQFYARVCRTPCRPDWLFDQFKPQIEALRPSLSNQLGAVDTVVKESYSNLCDKLAAVRQLKGNPLAEEVCAMLDLSKDAGEQLVVVIRQPSLWEEVKTVLGAEERGSSMSIMKPSEVRKAPPVDRLILFGPPWLFAYRSEEFLLRSPAAPNIDLFVYQQDFGGHVKQSGLDDQVLSFKGIETQPNQAVDLSNEPLFMFKPKTFVNRYISASGSMNATEGITIVDAWPVSLGNSKGTYLLPDGRAFCIVYQHRGEYAVCLEVERREVDELEPGDLIVLTTEGGGDLIRPVADEILGEKAVLFREHQNKWKQALRKLIETSDEAVILEELKAKGARRASSANLRNWIGDHNIGPADLDADFNAILSLIGFDNNKDAFREAITQLRSAHQSAGVQLQNNLQVMLKGLDVRRAFVDGDLEVRKDDNGPAKTIFLVENVERKSDMVPSYAIGRVFELEDEQ